VEARVRLSVQESGPVPLARLLVPMPVLMPELGPPRPRVPARRASPAAPAPVEQVKMRPAAEPQVAPSVAPV
jgi:hypothetical protein